MEDTNRSMAVYRDGEDLPERMHTLCFTIGRDRLHANDPHKLNDVNRELHERLACHKMHFIPVGFYYAKCLEKLDFYLRNNRNKMAALPDLLKHQLQHLVNRRTLRLHLLLAATPSSAPGHQEPSSERKALMEKRAAIFETKSFTSTDGEERLKQWMSSSKNSNKSEEDFNEQYDEEQLSIVKERIAELNKKETQKQQKSGDAMALPGKTVFKFAQRSLSLSFPQATPGKSTHQELSLFYLVPIADTARTTATYITSADLSLSLSLFYTHNTMQEKVSVTHSFRQRRDEAT
jgi:hypothetical protein